MFVFIGVLLLSISSVFAGTAEEYYKKGLAYGEQGKLVQAISNFTKAIENKPQYAKAYNNRGAAYYKQGDLTHAIFDFGSAIEIDHNYTEAYCNRGLAYAKQGNLPLAIADFSRAIYIDPHYAKAYANRAVAYFDEKEYDKAWIDEHKAEELGNIPNPAFLEDLKKTSGRAK